MPGEKIAIAIYFYRLGNLGGGAERMVCALANTLCGYGLRVHVVTWDRPNVSSYYPLDHRVEWHRLGFKSGLIDKFRRIRVLADALRRERVRVLVGFVMSGDKTVYAAAKLAGVRLVAAERNAPAMYYLRYTALQRWQYFTLLRLVDRIVVQFEDFSEGYPKELQSRIVTIPNPVPRAERAAAPGQPNAAGRYTLLAVGRLDGVQKRLGCLIAAFGQVATDHPAWDLVVVGDGPERETLVRQAADCGIADRAKFDASTRDIYSAYAEAQLFVIPSLWEGFPNALAEAMSHGLPAVGFAGAEGVSHLIDDGESGWLAEGLDDAKALARTLDKAMADHSERARRGQLAVQAMAAYPPEALFLKWQDLIEKLADTK